MKILSVPVFIFLFFMLITSPSDGIDEKYDKSHAGSEQLEKIKKLSGIWEGSESESDNEMNVTLEYKVTAGGSAVIETLFPGTPKEMISIYHDRKGKLFMTHYCMLKNRPVMEFKKEDGNRIDLIFSKKSDVNPKKDPHMHALSIEFIDDNHITQKWTLFEKGKEKHVSIFKLTRRQKINEDQ